MDFCSNLFTWDLQGYHMPNGIFSSISGLAHITTAILEAWSQDITQHSALRTRNHHVASDDADLYRGLTSVENAPELYSHVERRKYFA